MRLTLFILVAIATSISSSKGNMAAALSTMSTSKIRNSPPPQPILTSALTHVLESSSTVEKDKIGLPLDGSNNLSPFLQEMVDEQRALQMNVGKALDTLRKDYPYFLKRAPGKSYAKQ